MIVIQIANAIMIMCILGWLGAKMEIDTIKKTFYLVMYIILLHMFVLVTKDIMQMLGGLWIS